jgi:hypothetical protein
VDRGTAFFSDAGIVYEEWYDNFNQQIDQTEERDETGTLNRFGDSVLKVAMLLSLANAPELYISESAMLEAIAICEKLIGNVRRTTLGRQGLSVSAALKTKIIKILLRRDDHQISQTMLMKQLWMDFTSVAELSDVLVSLEGAKTVEISNIGNQIIIKMPDKTATDYTKQWEGKTQ